MSDQWSDKMGNGLGPGQGFGYRPEQETETSHYESHVRAKPKAGEAVRIGDASGPNRAGVSKETIKEQIVSSLSKDADPLTDQRLPRSEREHVEQYYKRLRKGE